MFCYVLSARDGRTDPVRTTRDGRTDPARPDHPGRTDGRTKKALKQHIFIIFRYFLTLLLCFTIFCHVFLCFWYVLLCFCYVLLSSPPCTKKSANMKRIRANITKDQNSDLGREDGNGLLKWSALGKHSKTYQKHRKT